jgi:hypothetical protein
VRWDAIRREVYGSFLAKSSACHASLCRVAWRIDPKRERRQDEIDSRWREANELRSDVIALRGQLDILATDPTRKAAAAIVERLDALNAELYSHDRNRTRPQSEGEYNASYGTLRDGFVQTIRTELEL